jgi:allantoate deiminase
MAEPHAITEYEADAARVLERCAALGAISEEPDRLTRRYGTEAMRRVNATVAEWMRAAGMAARQDHLGNLIGRYEGDAPGARTLLLGSHLDTVRDAGRYDGPLGVMVALACVERLHARGRRLPYAIETLAFADEEGLRYQSGYLGSSVYAGRFDPTTLARPDADGITLAEAIRAFGGDPDALAVDARAKDDLLGYYEVHIEQGPVLEARDLPVGIVSSIQGASRIRVRFTGQAGHAGTVPHAMRHDALAGAALFVTGVQTFLRNAKDDIVATVGQLTVQPGASNVIPGEVTLSLDVRHPRDSARELACTAFQKIAESSARYNNGLELEWQPLGSSRSVECSPRLAGLLERAITQRGLAPFRLASGAGHDGVMLSRLTGIAMLFVRCAGGISHNPAESVTQADVAVAIAVLEDAMALLADEVAARAAEQEGDA